MTKEEFVKKVAGLPGVGKGAAEKLYDAGYTSLDDLKAASADDLTAVEGIGPKTAAAIVQGIQDMEAPAAEEEIEVVEEGAAPTARAEPEAEIVEAEEAYQVKIKPQLDEATQRLLDIRADRHRREPQFKRYTWWFRGAVGEEWRAPKGTLNKQRRGFKHRPPRVKVGYGKPAPVRGRHPSGFEEVLVHNVKDLESIDPSTQAARIGGTVGKKKRVDIVAAAAEKDIRVLNPGRLNR